MIGPRIDPEQALDELAEHARKLGRGLDTMARVGPLARGVSERECIYREDKLALYRYLPFDRSAGSGGTPVLIVYALVNRPYMMDLTEQRSTIRGLLAAGLDVYLIDWGYPDRDDRARRLDEYVCGYLVRCVEQVRRRCGLERVNLLGVCQGGTLALCYAALEPERVGNLVTMVTPVDFHTPDNHLSRMIRHVDIDRMVDTFGNVPGAFLNWAFVSLKPYRLTSQKYVDLVDRMGDREALRDFLAMEQWIYDSPDQPGEAFRHFAKEFFQGNKLIHGEVVLDGRTVDLRRLTMPVLNVYATRDHLVPPAASRALAGCVGSPDYSEHAFEGGHIGIYVSARAQRSVPPLIAHWLGERS